jgi:hypothetical protein
LQCTDVCESKSMLYNDFLDFYYDGWIETLDWVVKQDVDVVVRRLAHSAALILLARLLLSLLFPVKGMSHIDHQKHRSGNRQGEDEQAPYNCRIFRCLKTITL